MKTLIVALAVGLAACATVPTFRPAANQDQQALASADYDSRLQVKEASKGRWASGGLLFLAIAAQSAANQDRDLYVSCMQAHGFVANP